MKSVLLQPKCSSRIAVRKPYRAVEIIAEGRAQNGAAASPARRARAACYNLSRTTTPFGMEVTLRGRAAASRAARECRRPVSKATEGSCFDVVEGSGGAR